MQTPIGEIPTPDGIDTTGLDISTEDLTAALAVDPDEWALEIPQIVGWFAKFGDKLPAALSGPNSTPSKPASTPQ